MDWKKIAIEDLTRYTSLIRANENLKNKLAEIESNLSEVNSINYSSIPVSGTGECKQEAHLISLIVLKEKYKIQIKNNKNVIKSIEKGLSLLNDVEKKVIDRFYLNRTKNHVEDLIQELNYEKSQVYKIKDIALSKYVLNQYGLSET